MSTTETRERVNISNSNTGNTVHTIDSNMHLAEKGLQEAVYATINSFLTENKGKPISDLYDQLLRQIEPPLLKVVMEKYRSNQLQAAKILGVSRGTIRKMLLRYFGTRYFRLTED